MNEQLMFTFLQIEYLGYSSSFAHYQPRSSEVQSHLQFLKLNQHCFLLDIFSYDMVMEISIDIPREFCLRVLHLSLGLGYSASRVKADYHWGLRHGVSLQAQCLQWELSPSRLFNIKRFLASNRQSLAQQLHFISSVILLILLLEITFSPLCFLEFQFIGKCLEELGTLI